MFVSFPVAAFGSERQFKLILDLGEKLMRSTTIGVMFLAAIFLCSASGLAQETKEKSPNRVRTRLVSRLDTNGDGKIDKSERKAADKRFLPVRRRADEGAKKRSTAPKPAAHGGHGSSSSKAKRPASKPGKKSPKSPRIVRDRRDPKPKGMKK